MNQPQPLPIGVFDSGLGGLTVLKALIKRLPGEDFVYLGDVARLPYGSKSQCVVLEYTRQCVAFLERQPVKAVVVACNTASAMAVERLRHEVRVPLFGVVDSGARAGLAACSGTGRVMVLGTESTVKSEAYLKAFSALAPGVEVVQLACPLLVPLAEEGWWDHSITRDVIRHYVSGLDIERLDAVVLGCTHFPLVEPSLRRVLPPRLPLVHGGALLAIELARHLEGAGLANSSRRKGAVRLLTTDRVSLRLPLLKDWLAQAEHPQTVNL